MPNDKGTWTAKIASRSGFGGAKVERVLLDSDDFEHDVLLERCEATLPVCKSGLTTRRTWQTG
jgi:hypothetical protein